ncbi:MAG: O-Antigen ligase [Pelotomaculum sp. PtaB.Bin104]|nr:MAG: O-Antigen ligase [Pelotomaculum sp. PtaB.Bin104]
MSMISGKSNKTKNLSSGVKKRALDVGKGKKTAGIKTTTEMVRWGFSRTLAFWGLAVLLFFSHYFKALYFPPQQERALIFAAVIFWLVWLWKWSRQDSIFLADPLDYFVLVFPAVYLFSAFQAANYGLAVDEVVKAALCFLIYWSASRLVRNERDTVTILQVIYLSAAGVALAGLAAATNMIYINRGFLFGRICSVLQYPNTLASLLAAVTLIGLYLWRRAGTVETGSPFAGINFKCINQYLYAAANFLLFAVFIGTKSQGGFLVFLVAITLFFIVIPKSDRAPVFIHFVACCLFSSLTIWLFLHAVADGKTGLAWLWVLLGLVIVLAAQWLYNYFESRGLPRWISEHKKILLAAFLLFVIACLIGAGIYAGGHGDIVKTGIEKIHFRSAIERMYFYHDALKMFRERPILGWGGGGWDEAYRAYQGYFYNSDKIHGYYFQVMVETGVVGLLALLGIWASFLKLTHRLYHGSKTAVAGKFLISVITVAAVSLGLHAAIDFDLSLSSLALVLWTMFGLARGAGIYSGAGAEDKKSKKYVPPNYVVPVIVSAASILVIIFAGSLVLAGNYSAQVGTKVQIQNISQSMETLKKASGYNPFTADYHSNLARLYQYQGNFEEGIYHAQKAVGLSKYNAIRYVELANLFWGKEDGGEEAVNNAEKALSLAPFQVERYEFLAATYFKAGYNDLLKGSRDTAKYYFEKAAGVPDRIENIAATLNDTEKKLWKDAPMICPTAAVKLNVGKSLYLLGRWPEADQTLQAALAGEEVKGEAMLWLAVLRDRQGRTQEAQDLLAEAEKLSPESARKYEEIGSVGTLTY